METYIITMIVVWIELAACVPLAVVLVREWREQNRERDNIKRQWDDIRRC